MFVFANNFQINFSKFLAIKMRLKQNNFGQIEEQVRKIHKFFLPALFFNKSDGS